MDAEQEKELEEAMNRIGHEEVQRARIEIEHAACCAHERLKESVKMLGDLSKMTIPMDLLKIIATGGCVRSTILELGRNYCQSSLFQIGLQADSQIVFGSEVEHMKVHPGQYRITVIVERLGDVPKRESEPR